MDGNANIGIGTKKLYYDDAYCAVFRATVLSCEECGNAENCCAGSGDPCCGNAPACYAVILDQTAFFPEEGGQSPDRGTLRVADPDGTSADVLDVQIHNGVITHFVSAPFEAGTIVEGALDFAHRFSNMQQHSAEHLYSGVVRAALGYENVGFHLSDREVTMDYSGKLTEEQAAQFERRVNEVIWQNIESRQLFPTKEEEKQLDYRSKIEIEGQVRVIEFPGVDLCACCAPHVRRTGEIGIFKVVRIQSYKGGTRVTMLAGDRALALLAAEHEELGRTARLFSAQPDQVADRAAALKDEAFRLRGALGAAKRELLARAVMEIPAAQQSVCLFTEGVDGKALCETAGDLAQERRGVCGIFDGNDEDGYRYAVGHAGDVRAVQKILTEKLGARGGGKPPVVQGSVSAPAAEIRNVIEMIGEM